MRILRFALFFVSLSAYGVVEIMSTDPIEIRVELFKKKIDYDASIRRHVKSEKIDFDWGGIGSPANFVISDMSYERVPHPFLTDEWTWVYRSNEEGMRVKVVSYSDNQNKAIDAIANFALRSNMMEPPYVKGPSDLGTISIMLEGAGIFNVYWSYRNVEFSVEGNNKTAVLKAAYWINSIAEEHRVAR
jgi:hypothetical protein